MQRVYFAAPGHDLGGAITQVDSARDVRLTCDAPHGASVLLSMIAASATRS